MVARLQDVLAGVIFDSIKRDRGNALIHLLRSSPVFGTLPSSRLYVHVDPCPLSVSDLAIWRRLSFAQWPSLRVGDNSGSVYPSRVVHWRST
jgi:hypothetical protein